jgi:hypothetical protein
MLRDDVILENNATTTQRCGQRSRPAAVLAARYEVTLGTIYCWQVRTSFEDRSHTVRQLTTTLTRLEAAVVVELRRMLLLPLDRLLAVTSFSTPVVHLQVWLAACTAMEQAISMPCGLRHHRTRTRRSSAMNPAFSTSTLNTCRKWRMKLPGVPCSWPLTGRNGGSLC